MTAYLDGRVNGVTVALLILAVLIIIRLIHRPNGD